MGKQQDFPALMALRKPCNKETHRLSICILPLTLAAIIFATAVPIGLRAPLMFGVKFDLQDFGLNVLLYVPLGLCLKQRRVITSLAGATILSTAIEILQMWDVDRYSGLFDVLANVLGTAAGVIIARILVNTGKAMPARLQLDWRLTIASAVGVILLSTSTWPARQSLISNWDAGFGMLIGNEETSDRPWSGRVEALAILPLWLPHREILNYTDLKKPDVFASLVERGAYILPAPLILDGGRTKRIPPAWVRRFCDLAIGRNAFSILIAVTTADAFQSGPARLISFSRDTLNRNFDLGQEGSQLVFRIRTTTSGPNGMNPHTETPPVFETGRPIFVAATFDGAVARVFVDGQARGRANLAAAGCLIPALCDEHLPAVSALIGALLAIITIVMGKPRSPVGIIMLAVLAGVIGSTSLYKLYLERAPLLFNGWDLLMVLAGACCIGISTSVNQVEVGKGIPE